MYKKELKFILQEGEGQFIEFKEKLDKKIAQEIVAFANSEGGRIFVGVSDDNKIKGVNITNKLQSEVQDMARNCDPSIGIGLKKFEDILVIEVKEGKDKPYKCKEGFYLRQGANSQKMSRDRILSLAIDEGKIRFDGQINKDFDFKKDFDKEIFMLFLKKNNLFTGLDVKDVLISLGLALKEEKKLFLNNAGVLFFAKDPQKFFLHAYLDCVLFKGKDKSEIIDRKTFRLGLLEQLFSGKEFVKKHLNLSYEFEGFEREERYEIPLRAIEEALVNALMHRDYFFRGANISLSIYDDRLEIISPGGLPKGLDKINFGKLSVRRNQLIADIFSKTPYVEQIGSGIKRMRNMLRKAGLPPPRFEMNTFFAVTFRRRNLLSEAELKGLAERLAERLAESQKKIIKLVSANSFISKQELSKKIGISTTAIDKNILKLKKKGLLKRVGPAKGGYWEIVKRG